MSSVAPHRFAPFSRRAWAWGLGRRWTVPAVLFGALAACGLFAPLISPHNPWDLADLRLEDSALAPTWLGAAPSGSSDRLYLLGSDTQGRDMLSATLYGLRVSLWVGAAATVLALVAGVLLGLGAGYWRGAIDSVVMRLADVQLSFPSMLIALFLMSVWGRGLLKIIVAVAIVHWVIYARTVRGVVLAEREKEYVQAARALGAGTPRILLRHLLPNLTTPIIVISAVEFASVVMLEATLSFLGLGVPITQPSLGLLIKNGYDEFFSGAWWIWLFPGLALVALVWSLNWLAEALRRELQG